MEDQQPIIVIRKVVKGHGGHHGGAWKVAFADFATAMMAFFLVLWLSASTTPEQKAAVAGYFKDPVGFTKGGSPLAIDLGGTPAVVNITLKKADQNERNNEKNKANLDLKANQVEQLAATLEKKKLQEVMDQLKKKIDSNPLLKEFKDQIKLNITKDGLQIQIVDKEKRPMFDSGSAVLKVYSEDILTELAVTLSQLPNKISITGHTDAHPFVGRPDYSNWELSADRANAARRALTEAGISDKQIARVVGLAASVPYDKTHPYAAVNRRISILVLNKKAEKAIEQSGGAGEGNHTVFPGIDIKKPGLLSKPDAVEPVKPAQIKPGIKKLVTGNSVINKPITNKPVINKSAINKPITNKPAINESITNKPVINIPAINMPIIKIPLFKIPHTKNLGVPATAKKAVPKSKKGSSDTPFGEPGKGSTGNLSF